MVDLVEEQKKINLELKTFNAALYVESLTSDYVIRMQAYMVQAFTNLFLQEVEVVEYSWPASWWDHFKEQYFPAWLLKNFPSKKITKSHKVYLQYPDISFPDKEHRVILTKGE